MSTYKVKMTSGAQGNSAEITKLSESEVQTLEKKTEKVSIKLSPRMLKRMKQITGLQGKVSNDTILYTFTKYMITNFSQ